LGGMPQILLFPDPRPLVERLGAEFFRRAPTHPGVYLMRDAAERVVYVGKAKNLRKRLASYRVANPDRLRGRQLRLLNAVVRIDFEECADEAAALAREAELLLALRPRFNRAGTWAGPPRYLAWKETEAGLELAVLDAAEAGWQIHGPMGAGAWPLRAALARLLWGALQPRRGLAAAPVGWFHSRRKQTARIPRETAATRALGEAEARLRALFDGGAEEFAAWIRAGAPTPDCPFEVAAREADLEFVTSFPGLDRNAERGSGS